MSLYDDIRKIAENQQFRTGGTNARFREEWIRRHMQNPTAFYQRYGSQLQRPVVSNEPTISLTPTQPTEPQQLPSIPSGDTVTYTGEGGGGYETPYYSTDQNVASNRGIGSGGLFGTNPYTGQVIGMGLGLAGLPFSNVAGQALSGTPESLASVVKGTAINYGANALAKGIGLNKNVPVGLLGSILAGRTPTKEDIALAFISKANPVLGLVISAGQAINRGMARDYERAGTYGLHPQNTSWGPPTLASKARGFFGGATNEMKDDDGTGFVPNPALGLGFNAPGMYPGKEDMGGAQGLTPPKGEDITAVWGGLPVGAGRGMSLSELYSVLSTPVSTPSIETTDIPSFTPAATTSPVATPTVETTPLGTLEDLYSQTYGIPASDPWGGSNTWGGWGTGDSGGGGGGYADNDAGGGFGSGSVGGSGEGEASDGLPW